jgi:hypothetical protein
MTIKSDLEYLLDVVRNYNSYMSHHELKIHIKEAIRLKDRDEQERQDRIDDIENEVFNN